MGLRPLDIFELFQHVQCVYRREILTYKDGPHAERVEFLNHTYNNSMTDMFENNRAVASGTWCKFEQSVIVVLGKSRHCQYTYT